MVILIIFLLFCCEMFESFYISMVAQKPPRLSRKTMSIPKLSLKKEISVFQKSLTSRSSKSSSKKAKSQSPPALWTSVSSVLKESARNWFIIRAENKGIDWNDMVACNKLKMQRLEQIKNECTDASLNYPDYYVQAFHGYDGGNLNWLAALELEPATLNIAVNYWKESNPQITQDWLRYNVSQSITNYMNNKQQSNTIIDTDKLAILDIGCSLGISTEYLSRTFPGADINGIDLSPYFISMAKLRVEEQNLKNIRYSHQNAEYTNFHNNKFDIVTCNFIMHELPEQATKDIIDEIFRVLKPGATVAIFDLTPKVIKDKDVLSDFKRWAFEVTEPHIYGYYQRDLSVLLEDAGFIETQTDKNDPFNSVWMATKPDGVENEDE